MSPLVPVAGALSVVSELGCRVAVVVVIATVVRRHCPVAYRPLLGWSIASLAWTACVQLGYAAMNHLMQLGTGDDFMAAHSALSIVSTAAETALTAWLLMGLVTLAKQSAAVGHRSVSR